MLKLGFHDISAKSLQSWVCWKREYMCMHCADHLFAHITTNFKLFKLPLKISLKMCICNSMLMWVQWAQENIFTNFLIVYIRCIPLYAWRTAFQLLRGFYKAVALNDVKINSFINNIYSHHIVWRNADEAFLQKAVKSYGLGYIIPENTGTTWSEQQKTEHFKIMKRYSSTVT